MPNKITVDLTKLHTLRDEYLIIGLARLYLSEIDHEDCNAGGQAYYSRVGRLLKKLIQKEIKQ